MSLFENITDETITTERTKKPTCLRECKPGDIVDIEGVRYIVSRPSQGGRKVWVRRFFKDQREGEIEYRDPDVPVTSVRARP